MHEDEPRRHDFKNAAIRCVLRQRRIRLRRQAKRERACLIKPDEPRVPACCGLHKLPDRQRIEKFIRHQPERTIRHIIERSDMPGLRANLGERLQLLRP